MQAQISARLGDLAATERALYRAEQVAKAGASQTSGWLRFERSRLDVTLGRPDLAESILLNALNKELSIRRRGGVLTDLAIAGAQRGDVDQLLMYGAAALDTVRQTASRGYLGRKAADLRRKVKPYLGDRHVRHLDTQIRESVTASAC